MEHAGLLRNNITEARLRTLPAVGCTHRPQLSLYVMKVLQIWKSRQNGMVYDPEGIAPCLCVGNHSGVEPKIIEIEHYEQDNRRE